jgi:hypothetical protein
MIVFIESYRAVVVLPHCRVIWNTIKPAAVVVKEEDDDRSSREWAGTATTVLFFLRRGLAARPR